MTTMSSIPIMAARFGSVSVMVILPNLSEDSDGFTSDDPRLTFVTDAANMPNSVNVQNSANTVDEEEMKKRVRNQALKNRLRLQNKRVGQDKNKEENIYMNQLLDQVKRENDHQKTIMSMFETLDLSAMSDLSMRLLELSSGRPKLSLDMIPREPILPLTIPQVASSHVQTTSSQVQVSDLESTQGKKKMMVETQLHRYKPIKV